MKSENVKKHLPTVAGYLERRRVRAKNQLPKHLRPLPRWPIVLQMALNVGIFIALLTLILNQDDYLTDAGPAVVMVVCLLLIIVAIYEGFQLRRRYQKTNFQRWTTVNLWLLGLAFIMFPICVATFLR